MFCANVTILSNYHSFLLFFRDKGSLEFFNHSCLLETVYHYNNFVSLLVSITMSFFKYHVKINDFESWFFFDRIEYLRGVTILIPSGKENMDVYYNQCTRIESKTLFTYNYIIKRFNQKVCRKILARFRNEWSFISS